MIKINNYYLYSYYIMSYSENVTFSGEYVFSVFCGLASAYLIEINAPKTNAIIKFFIIPIFITYLILLVINTIAPSFNESSRKFNAYVKDRSLTNINSLGYIQIFPPLFAVLIIFVILLYNRSFNQT